MFEIIKECCQLLNTIIQILKEDYQLLDIVINLGLLAAAILALIFGGKKLNELYNEYIMKKHSALFNFYAQFDSFLEELKNLISKKSEEAESEPSDIMYKIFCQKELAEKYYVSKEEIKQLHRHVELFLKYIYTAPEQIPLRIEKMDSLNNWMKKKKELNYT